MLIEKFRIEGNARARVFKVRLICPAVVTKTRGAEAISAAASSACAALRRAAACGILPHAHAKRKRKHSTRKEKGRAGGPNFEPEHPLARLDILHATNQDKIHECSLLSNRPFACDQQIGTHVLSSSNKPFACD